MTEAIRSVKHNEFATRCMLFQIAEAAWLMYSQKTMEYFGMTSFEAQDMILKRRLSSVGSVAKEGQASPAAPADAVISDDDGED